jgi:hypothetical protein
MNRRNASLPDFINYIFNKIRKDELIKTELSILEATLDKPEQIQYVSRLQGYRTGILYVEKTFNELYNKFINDEIEE